MSVYKKVNTNNEDKKNNINNESPLIILKNQNNNLGEELNRINNLVTKLKTQITKNEQEKNILISNNKKKEKNLQEISKMLEEANAQLTELKNKELELQSKTNNDVNSLEEKNDKENNNKTILELQKKITDLELQLKLSEKKKFTSLTEGKNTSIEIFKISNNNINNKINLYSPLRENNVNNEENVSLYDLNNAKNKNKKLQENIIKIQEEYETIEKEKKELLLKLNHYNNDKKKLIILLSQKDQDINEKINKEKLLNDDINKQLNENNKIKNNINIIQIKCQSLLKNKMILEDTVIKQENKLTELNNSIEEVMKIINKKENEINHDKIYINNLKEIINDLQKEYNNVEIRNKINSHNKELINLKIQLNALKNKPKNIININHVNNISNRNYLNKNNHPLNYLYQNKNNILTGRKKNQKNINHQNNKSLFIPKNKLIITNRNIKNNVPKIFINHKYKIINNRNQRNNSRQNNNNSLPNVEKYLRKNENKIDIEDKNNIKSQILNNYAFDIVNPEYKADSIPRLYQKHLNISKKEELEKQKIDEVKDLLDKIVSDFEN